MRRGLVVQFVPLYVMVTLCGLSPYLTLLQSGGVVVMVIVVVMPAVTGIAVCLVFVMFVVMMQGLAIAVLVLFIVLKVEAVVVTVIRVAAPVTQGFLWVQRGPLALWCGAVLPHLVDEADFGHVVYDEHFSPVRDWFGLSSTEMNVHDENC